MLFSTLHDERRYLAVVVDVTLARARNWKANGEIEVEPRLLGMKRLRKGYLHSSYEKVDPSDPDAKSPDDLLSIFGDGQGALPAGLRDDGLEELHPHVNARFEVWGDVDDLKHLGRQPPVFFFFFFFFFSCVLCCCCCCL